MDISAQASSLAERPQRAIWVTSVRMRREDRTSISSLPLAVLGGYLNFFRSITRPEACLLQTARLPAKTPHAMRAKFVGERDCKHVAVQSLSGCFDPVLEPVPFPAHRFDEDDPGCLHEQNTQVAVTALRYLAKDGAVAGRHLLRHEAQPRGEVTAFGRTASLRSQWRPPWRSR